MSDPAAPADARILLVRPDHLGDVLLTLPAGAALRRALPTARISFLVPADAAAIPRHCPDVAETYLLPFPPLTAWPDAPGWPDIVAHEAPALRGRFDLALLPRPDDPWSGAVVAAAEIPTRLGYAWPRTRPYLTMALPLPGRRHVAALALDLAMAAADHLGAPGAIDSAALTRSCFIPTAAEEAEADAVLAGAGTTVGAGPFVLHPGSGWPLKNWPPRRWGVLAARLERCYGVAPLITGSRRERELVDAVVEASEQRARGLAGQLSLGGLAALHRRARVVIATDSGPLHLAAMVGAPVVGLYGPADPVEFRPTCPADRHRVVRVELPCSPCRTLLDPPCGASMEPPCVTGITVEAVLAAVADLLRA